MTKRKRIKEKRNEESIEVQEFAKVLAIVVICIVGIYFFTRAFITKDLFKDADLSDNSETAAEINYDVTSIGAMLSRPYDEYYVILYKSEEKTSVLYDTIRSSYMNLEDGLKIYYVDLSTTFNKQYYNSEETNPKAKNIEDLKLGDFTLIKIKNGKINKYIEDIETIKETLKTK